MLAEHFPERIATVWMLDVSALCYFEHVLHLRRFAVEAEHFPERIAAVWMLDVSNWVSCDCASPAKYAVGTQRFSEPGATVWLLVVRAFGFAWLGALGCAGKLCSCVL